ncbi:MAG: T9SS type A sorting domain-containing protein [candidate division WOR-3 bacterium]
MFEIILFFSIFNNFTHSDTFYSVFNRNDTIFITGDHGIYLFDFNKDSVFYKFTNSDSIPLYPYYAIFLKDSLLNFTNSENLIVINLKNNKKYFYPPLFLERDFYREIKIKGDTVFLAGNRGLKGIYRNNTIDTSDDSLFFERKNYFPKDTVISLEIIKDTLFIGTKLGLYKIKINLLGIIPPTLHSGILPGKIGDIFIFNNKIFVSSDSFLYLYPNSLLTKFPYVINSLNGNSDTLFVGTEGGSYILYNGQKLKFSNFNTKSLIKVKNKIYLLGKGIVIYDYKNSLFLNFKNYFKELTSNSISSVKKFGKYYLFSHDRGIDIFNEKYEKVNKLLGGWIRTLDVNPEIIITSPWCGPIFKIDSLFNIYDTLNLSTCIQLLKFLNDSTFSVLKPAQNSIEIRNLKDEKIKEIFNLGYATDIEKYADFYFVSNTEGNIYKIDKNYNISFVMNTGYPVYDISIYENKIFFATNSGLFEYKLPDFQFIKNYRTFDSYTVSVINDKYGNTYALTRSGLIFISRSGEEKIFESSYNTLTRTESIDFNSQCSASLLYYDNLNEEIIIGTKDGVSIMNLKVFGPSEAEEPIVFPNPFKKDRGFFYIKTKENLKEILIYSPSGRVKKLNFVNSGDRFKVNAFNLERGFYILVIKLDKDTKIKKIICE